MSETRIKICGLTTAGDARLAQALGADFLGVIFAEGPRRVSVERAREIREAVPSAAMVGVFRNAPLDEVVRTTGAALLDIVQLHGDESPDLCDEILARTGKPVIKTLTPGRVPAVGGLAAYRTTSFFLFDLAKVPGAAHTAHSLGEVARVRRLGFRVFLAGALGPANVRDAIRATTPFAVDVCRGVERAPGVKDADAIRRFVAEVRE